MNVGWPDLPGRSILASDLFSAHGSDVVSTGVYRVSASFWPIGAAFAVATLEAVVRCGERLQRETEVLI